MNPPMAVKEVMFGVLLMLGYAPEQANDWTEVVKVMKTKEFLSKLQSIDVIESFDSDTHDALSKLITEGKLSEERVGSVSIAAK